MSLLIRGRGGSVHIMVNSRTETSWASVSNRNAAPHATRPRIHTLLPVRPRCQVFSAASSRQSDPDERVRAKAVHAVCTAGAAQLALVGADALQTSTARLNDVKPHVRREAGSALAALFKAACRKLHEGARRRARLPLLPT